MRIAFMAGLAALAGLSGVSGAQQAPVQGFDPEQLAYCQYRDGLASEDVVIGGCTALIQSGKAESGMMAWLLLLRGEAYLRKGDISLALRDFDQALRMPAEVSPRGKAMLYTARGNAQEESKNYAFAIKDYDLAIAADPAYPQAYYWRGWTRYLQGRYDEALKDYDKALTLEQPDAEFTRGLHGGRGLALVKKGDADGAIAAYGQAIALADNSPVLAAFARGRAELRAKKGDRVGARADYDLALDASGIDAATTAELHALKAGTFLDDGDSKAAKAEYEKAIAAKSDYAGGHRGRAYALASMGDYRGAVAGYTKALELEPDNAFTLANRAYALGEIGSYEKSLADIDRAVALAPDNAEYRNAACWTRAADLKRDFERARTDCDAAIRLAPEVATYHDSRGLVWLQLARFEDAWRDYDAAVKLDAKDGHALYGRGVAALKLGRAEAQADMAKAIGLRKDAADLYAGYGVGPCAGKSAAMDAAGALMSDTPLGRLPVLCETEAGR